MIFITGRSSTNITSQTSYSTSCPSCGEKGNVVFRVDGKYVHFMFIPCFPTGKTLTAYCTKCNCVQDYYEMSPEMKNEIFHFSKKHKSPILHYTGAILVLLFFLFIIFGIIRADNRKANYIANPKINDLYEISIDADKSYTIMRIENIENDSVYFSINRYTINKSYKTEEINLNENFDTSHLLPVAIKDLDLKSIEGITLRAINRPQESTED